MSKDNRSNIDKSAVVEKKTVQNKPIILVILLLISAFAVSGCINTDKYEEFCREEGFDAFDIEDWCAYCVDIKNKTIVKKVPLDTIDGIVYYRKGGCDE